MWKYIKKFLKKIRDHLYRNFLTEHFIPIKKQILLESAPDFSDNTYSFYLELLKNNYQDKYKIVWLVTKEVDKRFYREDIEFFNINQKGIFHFLKFQLLINQSKFIITCNRFYKKKTKKQIIVFLNHGMPLKDCTKLKMNFKDADFSIVNSNFFVEELSKIINIKKEKFVELNAPRNDGLFDKSKDVKDILGLKDKKVVVWLPTYRKMNHIVASSFDMPLGIPVIYNEKELIKLNKYLEQKNIVLLLKPHFAQDMSKIKLHELNSFKLIYNVDLDKAGLTLYELLGQSDAMITDYSSVYYDYLLTDKPIGLTIDDIKEYSREFGITYDYKKYIKGHYINNINDMYDFLDNLFSENDVYYKDRMKAKKMFNHDLKGNYSKKVFDYLKDHYNF